MELDVIHGINVLVLTVGPVGSMALESEVILMETVIKAKWVETKCFTVKLQKQTNLGVDGVDVLNGDPPFDAPERESRRHTLFIFKNGNAPVLVFKGRLNLLEFLRGVFKLIN